MTKQEAHKAIVLLQVEVRRLQRIKLAALAIYSLERHGTEVARFSDNEEGRVEAIRTQGGLLTITQLNRGFSKVLYSSPIEVAEEAILKEVLS